MTAKDFFVIYYCHVITYDPDHEQLLRNAICKEQQLDEQVRSQDGTAVQQEQDSVCSLHG